MSKGPKVKSLIWLTGRALVLGASEIINARALIRSFHLLQEHRWAVLQRATRCHPCPFEYI